MKRRTTTIAIGAGFAAAVALTVVIGAASFAVTATPRLASTASDVGTSASPGPSASPSATATPSATPVPVRITANNDNGTNPTGANVGAGTPGTASLNLMPGPIEIATSDCMAIRGYTWSNALGIQIANAELAAVAASAQAGYALTDAQTRTAENAAAAAAAGVSADAYPAFRSALTGDFANDPSACSDQAVRANQSAGLGSDGDNFQAIQLACAADRGFPLTRAQQKTLFKTLESDGEAAAAAAVGWTVDQYHGYTAAVYGNTGTAADYHWEEAGCGGYATHATANDHNN
ncbi:hypothetical protein ACL9RL_19295 [Plantibacter sp. Mn2098]|uniref:hypothetical protein n=1 Tax=Plantibacter sp. Mn2098 TaxID=3395266 RepID=UPI003BCFEEB4